MAEYRFTFYAGLPDEIMVEAESEEEAYRLMHEEIDQNVICEEVDDACL